MLWRHLAHPLRQHVQCVSHVPDVYVVHFQYVTRQTAWSHRIKKQTVAERNDAAAAHGRTRTHQRAHARTRIDLNYSSDSINLPVTSITHISGVV